MDGTQRKLGRLHECCNVSIRSWLDREGLLCWTITVARLDGSLALITSTNRDLDAAAGCAIKLAEEAGWIGRTPDGPTLP